MAEKPKIPTNLVQRIILERDLTDSREVRCTQPDGSEVVFTIRSLSQEEKHDIRKQYDPYFPTPPVVQGKLGAAQFNLEDADFQLAIQVWNQKLSRGVLAAALGISEKEVLFIEQVFPREFVNKLFATIELINGIQSDPLVELVRDAMWAPEVLSWLEVTPPKHDGITLTDTPLFREMEALVAAGLSLDAWEALSPRHKIMYMNHHAYKIAREAYIQEMSDKKAKDQNQRRMT